MCDDSETGGDTIDDAHRNTVSPVSPALTLHGRDPSAATFGIELLDASPHGATVRMPVRTGYCNGFGIVHGGITFLLADSAMAFASNAAGEVALASSAGIDWLVPVDDGDVLTARAERRAGGGRSALWDVTVTNSAGVVVALMRGRTRTAGRPVIEP